MAAAEGILTSRGGMTSHAAVVARGMGKCCVSGCSEALISEKNKTLTINGKVYGADDFISLDGSTGLVYEGSVPTVEAEMSDNFQTIMEWTDEISEMKVRANADTPHDSQVARDLGAKGIGLTRTEHMFFEADRHHFTENLHDLQFLRCELRGIYGAAAKKTAHIRIHIHRLAF